MKDYASMSDREIAEKIGKYIGLGSAGGYLYMKNGYWTRFDPCNNPADAWPILLENEISLHFNYEEWDTCTAHAGREEMLEYEFSTFHANPLRAAMIVFLMMKESER